MTDPNRPDPAQGGGGVGWPAAPLPERTRFATPPADPAASEPSVPAPDVPGLDGPSPEVPDLDAPGPDVGEPDVPAPPVPPAPEPLVPPEPEPGVPVPPAPEPVLPEPILPEPGGPEPVTPQHPAPEPVLPDPVLPELATAAEDAPRAAHPVEPGLPEPVAVDPAPATGDAVTHELAAAAPAGPAAVSADPTDEPTDEPVARTGRGKGLVAVAAGVVVVLAALTGFLAWRAHDTQGAGPVAAARSSALDAARTSARLVFSYDYRHLAQDFKAGRAVTTGQFQGEYDKTTAKLVTDVAPRYKAVVVADVSDAGVVSATTDQVVALVFLNQQSSSSLVAAPKITQSRLEMTLVRKEGRWLVEKIKAL